jgi:hypothetical protein
MLYPRTSDLSEAAAEHIQLKEQLASLRDRFTGKLADLIGGTQHTNRIHANTLALAYPL